MFNKKVKKLLAVVSVVAMTAGLTIGCAAPAAEEAAPAEDAAAEEAPAEDATEEASGEGYTGKLVISIHDQLNNPAIVEGIEALGATDKWKGVEIEVKEKDQEYAVNMPIQIMGGEQIDIIYNFNPIEQDKNASSGLLVPLDEYVAELGIDMEARYGSNAAAAYNYGEIYGIPGGYTSWGLFYNKAIFDEAGIDYPSMDTPMTWDEYRALAVELTSGEGADKVYGALHLQWGMFWYGEAIMKLGGGQHFYNAEGLSNISDPAFVDALEATYQMQNVDESMPKQADIIANKFEPDGFFTGDYAMYPHGTWMFNWLADTETYPRDWEVGFAPMPVPEGTEGMMSWGVCGTFGVPATSADPLMATDFCVDLVAYAAENSPAEPYADITVEAKNLYATVEDDIADEGMTAENIKSVFFNPDTVSVTEKVAGANPAEYEAVINEEVQKYLADAQDLDTTLKNIEERGNEVIQEAAE